MGQQAEEAEGEVVVEAPGGSAGRPVVSFSRPHVVHHLVPGVQDHGVDGVVADHVAGFQQLGELPLGLQGDVHQGCRAGVPEERASKVLRVRQAAPPEPQTRLKVE